MARHLSKAWPEFDQPGFIAHATHHLDELELKQRSQQITAALAEFLPANYEQAARVMLDSLAPAEGCDVNQNESEEGIVGWSIMPMVDYVGLYGLEHFDLSMQLFRELTKRSSSEFGIRYFLKAKPEQTLAVLETWIDDPNQHVRRLISEGTRPRLPWGMRLMDFIDEPMPVIKLLESLKDDNEEYVRRSVANNLNDIAKDHPDLVAQIAKRWLVGADKNRLRLVKHACRTLIKQGHKPTLVALGYGVPKVELKGFEVLTPQVELGSALAFEVLLESTVDSEQNLIIDYAIHHRKANGKTSAKVFKWKTVCLKPRGTLEAKRTHKIKQITTRTYYKGLHYLELLVNGESLGLIDFDLSLNRQD